MQAIIAIDVGTGGAKAVLVGRDGAPVASGYAGYPTQTAAGNRVEQNPQDWWQGTCAALAQIGPALRDAEIAAVILSGQMQDVILLGEMEALGPAILYADCRAEAEAQFLAERIDASTLSRITGNAQGASSVLAKWLWLRAHDAARLESCRSLLVGAHDYVSWRLCGSIGADFTTAATTGLLDLTQNIWAVDLLDCLGLDVAQLPDLHPAGAIAGTVSAAAAQASGLPTGTPVFRGVGDLGATTVGVGAGVQGRTYAYLGTSGWIAASLDQATPAPDRGIFTLRHPDPQRFIQVAPMLTAGGNLAWARSKLLTNAESNTQVSYAVLDQLAAQAPAGSHGVIYLPYLSGERSPFSDPNARACFVGISARVDQTDLVRAVMEGTAMAYRTLCETLDGDDSGPLLLAGGGGRSAVWMQILADVLDRPVHVMDDPGDAAARGAAVIAGKALGWYDGYLPGQNFFPVAAFYTPNAAHRKLYDQLYAVFNDLYPQLQASFAALARVPGDDNE